MSCREESHQDDHGHGHGHGHGHDHDHSHDQEYALKESLLSKIDLEKVVCLNEKTPNSIQTVFKPWELRLERQNFVESDCDEQLIVLIPFTGLVKLKSILIKGGGGDQSPKEMKAFANRDDVDFDSADSTAADQKWDLVQDYHEVVEYQTRIAKFSNLRKLTLYFPSNYGGETSVITYIGLKGEWTELKDDPIITVYELQPNLADHQTEKIVDTNQHTF